MKEIAPSTRWKGFSVLRVVGLIAGTALVPLLLYAGAPSWWSQREVIVPATAPDDYAPANQGQVKHIATAAVREMDAKLPGGAGIALHELINNWSVSAAETNDFAPINVGQLKKVAKPFYDRLIAAALATQYPWTNSINNADDFAVANIGQVKKLFSFELPAADLLYDSDHNGLPDAWERQYFGAIGVDPRADPDADGSDNRQEYRDDTDPTRADSVREPKIVILSGDGQQSLPARFLAAPLVIRTLNYRGEPRRNTPVRFTVSSGGGGLTPDRFSVPVTTELESVSDENGLLHLDYQQGLDVAVTSRIAARVGHESESVTFLSSTVGIAPVARQTLAVGQSHALAVYSDGTVWSWGSNDRGELGDGTMDSRWLRAQVSGLSNIVSVSAFGQTSVALRSDGTVWTWGSNDGHALGNGSEESESTVPVQVLVTGASPLQDVVAIASGYYHNLALRSDGTVWAWGSDWAFQLGNDSETDSPYAIPVRTSDDSPLHDITQIACGDGHSLAVKRDGTVWTWGYNNDGEVLGTGITDWRSAVPAQVANLTDIVMLAASERHSIALKNDGTVWTWGTNGNGQLGNNTTSPSRPYPSQLLHLGQIIAVATGREHILALASNGNIWGWGDTQTAKATNECFPPTIRFPILVAHFQQAIGIAAGYSPIFALLAGGSIIGWRSNDNLQLGNPFAFAPVYARPVADFLLVDDADHDGITTSEEIQAGTDPTSYSTVGDSVPNTWKLFFGLSFTDPTLAQRDLTGKGLTVSQDYQFGTDPTKRSSVDDGIPDGWKIQYGISPLYCGVDTTDWIGKGMTIAMDYRVGTNPNKISTLDDNIPDAWKIAYKIDPLDPNALSRDDDNDGLTNLEEYQFHTDPTNADTDGNGTHDGDETRVIITIVSDTTQRYFLDQAFVSIVAEAKSPQGVALPNIPVTISVTKGSGALAVSPLLNPASTNTLTVRTGRNGRATVYFMPTSAGTVSQATVTAPQYGTVSGSNHVGGNVLNPKADDDGDGLINSEEFGLGTDPTNPDTDGDGRLDGDDIWPTSKVLEGPRVPETHYVAIETGLDRFVMNEAGQVAFVDPKRQTIISGTFLRDNFASDKDEQVIEATDLPPYNNDIRLRYGAPHPLDINSQGQVLALVPGYFEWNDVDGHINTGAPLFPNDPGLFNPHPFYDQIIIWTGGSTYNVPKPASTSLDYKAVNLNDAGAILFNVAVSLPSPDFGTHIFVWQGGYRDLGLAVGSRINNHGDVSGYKEFVGGGVWRDGAFTPIGGRDSFPTSLNDLGHVIGNASRLGIEYAWAWKDGETLDLGPGYPTCINNKGQIAGKDGFLWQNGHVYNLNARIGGDHPPIVTVEKITDTGIIVANSGKVILIPAELMVDANRDGEISFTNPGIHDADQTSEDSPYRFWVNDDDDGSAADPGDHVPPRAPDYADGTIQSIRDLEDFSRLQMMLGGLEDVLESGQIKVAIEWREFSGNPRIKLYRAMSNTTNYLTDATKATSQIIFPFRDSLGEVIPNAPMFLPEGFWTRNSQVANVPKTLPSAWFLFEGSGEGKGRLVLSFWKDNHKIGESGGVWLDLKNIKTMYQHQVLGGPDPWAGIKFEPSSNEQKEVITFVHGWRLSPDDTSNFAETMFKRLWWRGFKGRFAAVRWDTYYNENDHGWLPYIGQTLDAYLSKYNDSEHNAWSTGSALKVFVDGLPTDFSKHVVAHSMGNVVTGAALQNGMRIEGYALLNAALPASSYDERDSLQQPPATVTVSGIPFHLWAQQTPDDDPDPATRALAYRGRLKSVTGDLVSFYLPDDYATSFAWELNNALTKPPGGSLAGRFLYRRDFASGRKLIKGMEDPSSGDVVVDYYIVDPNEAEPYACRTWSKAVGAEGRTSGPIRRSIDLSSDVFSPSGSGGFSKEHSAEFNYDIQKVQRFYTELLTQLNIAQNQ